MSVQLSLIRPPEVVLTPGGPTPTCFLSVTGGPPGPAGPEGPQGEGIQSDNWPDFTLIFENKLV